MTVRPSMEITCDSHPGGPRLVARLTDCRTEPWPASPARLAAHEALCRQLLPGRAVTPSPEPVYGIAVTYTTRQRGKREHDWRHSGSGGRVETNMHGQRRYTFQCSHEHCRTRPPLVIGERLLGALIDSAAGIQSTTLTRLRRDIRSLAAGSAPLS